MTTLENQTEDSCPPEILINEVQLILAEKRTSLASLRTGIAVFAIPLSIMGMLIATSRYYEIVDVMPMFIAVMVINVILLALWAFLAIRGFIKLRYEDRMINNIKRNTVLLPSLSTNGSRSTLSNNTKKLSSKNVIILTASLQ